MTGNFPSGESVSTPPRHYASVTSDTAFRMLDVGMEPRDASSGSSIAEGTLKSLASRGNSLMLQLL